MVHVISSSKINSNWVVDLFYSGQYTIVWVNFTIFVNIFEQLDSVCTGHPIWNNGRVMINVSTYVIWYNNDDISVWNGSRNITSNPDKLVWLFRGPGSCWGPQAYGNYGMTWLNHNSLMGLAHTSHLLGFDSCCIHLGNVGNHAYYC